MNRIPKKVAFLLVLFLLLNGAFYIAWAEHHQHLGKDHDESTKPPEVTKLAPITNQTYQDLCGACHFAYQPFLLPSGSWEKILSGFDNHFGQAVEIDPESKKTIEEHLKNGAAEKSSARLAARIMKSLGSATPLRITETPYIQKQHEEISSNVLKREFIGSLSNCSACHQTAEKGSYNEDSVKVPK